MYPITLYYCLLPQPLQPATRIYNKSQHCSINLFHRTNTICVMKIEFIVLLYIYYYCTSAYFFFHWKKKCNKATTTHKEMKNRYIFALECRVLATAISLGMLFCSRFSTNTNTTAHNYRYYIL